MNQGYIYAYCISYERERFYKLKNYAVSEKEEKKLATEIDALTTLLFQGGGRREGVGQTIEKINYVIK